MTPQDVKYIAVHCADTYARMDIDWREIDRWHRKKGWTMIGYHYVIKRDGTIEETSRKLNMQGAHVEGYNHCSIGICLVGGKADDGGAEDNFTEDQKQSLAQLILELRQGGYAAATVQGHRDFPKVTKLCPSFDVRAWMQSVGL